MFKFLKKKPEEDFLSLEEMPSLLPKRPKKYPMGKFHIPMKVEKSWGYIEELSEGDGWRLDRISIKPGHSDKLHAQPSCRHSCYVEAGLGNVKVGPNMNSLATVTIAKDREFVINPDWLHSYENVGKTPLVIIQMSYGTYNLEEMVHEL